MDILRPLWKIKCTDIGIFPGLLDQQVQPAPTYAAEVWGAKKHKEIEKVRMYVCKKALSVRQKTPYTVIYESQANIRSTLIWQLVSQSAGALSPVNHKGLHQG